MAEASRRAGRPAARGGLPNAVFVVAGVEAPPPELAGRADLVTVRFPWGSLLRGLVGLDPRASAGLASFLAPGASLEAFVSVQERDGLDDVRARLADPSALTDTWSGLGSSLVDAGPVDRAELVAIGSTWAKRLGATAEDRRVVTRLRLVRLP